MRELSTERTHESSLAQAHEISSAEVSKVLRNTYALLAMTLAFSAVVATLAAVFNAPFMNPWIMIGGYFALLFAVAKTQNSGWGLVSVFALTGWLGYTLGPMISYYTHVSGFEPVLLALGGTAIIFFGLSGYVLVTRKDLSFATGFLMTGILVAFVASIANMFLNISGLSTALSCVFLFLSSGIIMWQTSQIIHGGERNYISATVTLYVMLYNIFTILLSFIGGGDD